MAISVQLPTNFDSSIIRDIFGPPIMCLLHSMLNMRPRKQYAI